jgi:tetratricopeptide (TPR) repeat protein
MKRWLFLFASMLAAGCGSNPPAENPQKLRADAETAFLSGEYAQAAAAYERLAKADPAGRTDALIWLGRSLNGAEQWDRAVKAFTDAIAARPGEVERLQALYFRGIAWAGAGRYRESLEDFLSVASVPQSLRGQAVKEDEFVYRHALARIRMGDWAGGTNDLKAFAGGFPDSPLVNDARDRLALKSVCILVGRAKDAAAAKALIAEARAKGVPAEAVQGPRDVMVVTGRYRDAAEARLELPRVQVSFRDAFVVP